MITRFLIPAIAVAILALTSCSKNKKPECRLAHVVEVYTGGSNNIDFTYDDRNRISTLTYNSGSNVAFNYTYPGNSIVRANIGNGGVITNIDSLLLNSSGLVESRYIREYGYSAKYVEHYNYNSSGEITSSTSQYDTDPIRTTVYTYDSGDLVKSESPDAVFTYTWYEDKQPAPGDFTFLLQIIQVGGIYWKPSHLIKTMTRDNDTTTYTYTFDEDGKITTITGQSNIGITVFTNTFDCP